MTPFATIKPNCLKRSVRHNTYSKLSSWICNIFPAYCSAERIVISQYMSALHSLIQYLLSNIDTRWMNLTSLGSELAEYGQGQSFWALRFLSELLRASFLKNKIYCRVRKQARPWPYRTNRLRRPCVKNKGQNRDANSKKKNCVADVMNISV